MPRKFSSERRSDCPISVALELLGDPWSLLIVRDLMFKGMKTFIEFQNAGEGIASNILTDRLSRLEAAGVLTKRRDEEDGRRFVYRLTAKGVDLAPLLIELVLWSAKHEDTGAPAATIREMQQHRKRVIDKVRAQWQRSNA